MKLAIPYSRVSTDEQAESGYSLPDQQQRINTWCNREGYSIPETFTDDYSGKTFDRPGFKKLLEYIKKNKVDLIVFTKWSRFSRNTTDAYGMIRTLKEKYGITVQAIDQPIDFSIPQNKYLLAFYLAEPEIDNDVRSDATTRGMRRALKEGRYVGSAPKGYINGRDENDKPILIPDPKLNGQVKQLFEMFATGNYSQAELIKLFPQLKFSRSRLAIALRNPIYCGLISVKSYKDEPTEIIRGIHEPIISESLFYKVQDVLSGKKRDKHKKHLKVTPELPLRGFLYCNEDHKMTGSCSHGTGGKYHYYHCKANQCERHRADLVNNSFAEFLKSIQIKKAYAAIYRETVEYFIKPDTSQINSLQSKIQAQSQRLQILQDKFIDGLITPEDYNQIRIRYEATLFDLNNQLQIIQDESKEFSANFGKSLTLLENLSEYYQSASVEMKRTIISSTIAGKIYFSEKKVRTKNLNPLIELLSNTGKGFSSNKVLTLEPIRELIPHGTPSDTESRTILLIEGAKKLSDCLKLVA